MGRDHRYVPPGARAVRFAVLWDLHWRVIECRRIDPGDPSRAALDDALARLAGDGWVAESAAQFGFTFVRRAAERRLLAITARNPFSTGAQSFSPFGARATPADIIGTLEGREGRLKT